jgi:hypothetical protein
VSTPRREEVEHRVEYGGALIRVAEAAEAFHTELMDAYPGLEAWDQGYAAAVDESVAALIARFRATGDLQLRCADADRQSRAASAHLAAIDHAEDLNELREMQKANAEVGADTLGPIGTRFRYVAEVAERGQLPTAHTDAEREGYKDASGGESLERRVYAVVGEEPVCVAVEGDGEWDFVKEVP